MSEDKLQDAYESYLKRYREKYGFPELGGKTFREWLEDQEASNILIKLNTGRYVQIQKRGHERYTLAIGWPGQDSVTGEEFVDTDYINKTVRGNTELCLLILRYGLVKAEFFETMSTLLKVYSKEILVEEDKE